MDAERAAGAWRFDRFTLDLARGALLGPDGAEVPLRPKSLALLRLLVENPGRVVDRDAIMEAVWPGVTVGDEFDHPVRPRHQEGAGRRGAAAAQDRAQARLPARGRGDAGGEHRTHPARRAPAGGDPGRRHRRLLAPDRAGRGRHAGRDQGPARAGDRPAAGRAQGPDRQADGRRGDRRVRLGGRRGRLRGGGAEGGGRPPGQDAGRPADRVPHRRQPRRRGGRGRRPPRRRGQRRRPAGAAVRARRRAGLRHGLRPPAGPARAAPGVHRRAAGQEHRPAGAGVPGAAGRDWRPGSGFPSGRSGAWRCRRLPRCCCSLACRGRASGGCWPGEQAAAWQARGSRCCRSPTSRATPGGSGSPTGSPRT